MAIVVAVSSARTEEIPSDACAELRAAGAPKSGKAISTRKKPQAETELLAIAKEIRVLLQSSATKPPLAQNQNPAKKKVLWIDDYPTNNEHLIKAYRSRGLYFDLVIDNDQAVERLQSNKYDLVITDMKHESDKEAGLHLLRWLRKHPPPCGSNGGRGTSA
ncbi:hypothetical protein [Sorangium sp. So ce131]|uniref:hypothetical protein n=1 Tax=Sorangium sp. So ce131 TaxID=3133282 RepID=UPI003F5E2A92